MAETQGNRSGTAQQGGKALERSTQNQEGIQRRNQGSWLASPFDFMDEMSRTFDSMFRDFGMPRRSWLTRGALGSGQAALWSPRVEAFQKGDRFIVRAELPGLKKDDVQVDMTEDAITIHGERHEEHEHEKGGYYRSERQYGEFYRSIPLPEGVISESAQASFSNGVLEISMQASPASANRGGRLEIKDTPESGGKK